MSKPEQETVELADWRDVDYEQMKKVSTVVTLSDIQTMSFAANSRQSLVGIMARDCEQQIGVRGSLMHTEGCVGVVLIEFDYSIGGSSPLASVNGAIVAIYSVKDGRDWSEFPVEASEQFAEVNGIYNTWSYVRELVASSLTRLGLAGVLLPLWRPPNKLPPKGEFSITNFSPDSTQKDP